MSEETLHRAVADYLRLTLAPETFVTTFPAGGGGRVRGARLKAMGLKAGMPDLMIWWPGSDGWARCLGIELKSAKGRLSPDQRATHAALREAGCLIEVCRSIDDVQRALRAWSVPTKGRIA